MKILGFAHLTFALSLGDFPGPFTCLETYQRLDNAGSKLELMKHKDYHHNLQLVGVHTELTYYESLDSSNQKREIRNTIQKHIQNPKEIWIKNMSVTVLQVLNSLAPRSLFISQNSLRIKGVGTLSEVTLTKSDSGMHLNEFLDEYGPVALGFYVDKFDQNLEVLYSELNINIEVQEPFEFRVGKNFFKILFVKIGGINFEFLQRK